MVYLELEPRRIARLWFQKPDHCLSVLPRPLFKTNTSSNGIIVGQIAYSPGSSYALLKSSNCGLVAAHTANQILSNITEISTTYANDCYSQDQSNAVACKFGSSLHEQLVSEQLVTMLTEYSESIVLFHEHRFHCPRCHRTLLRCTSHLTSA